MAFLNKFMETNLGGRVHLTVEVDIMAHNLSGPSPYAYDENGGENVFQFNGVNYLCMHVDMEDRTIQLNIPIKRWQKHPEYKATFEASDVVTLDMDGTFEHVYDELMFFVDKITSCEQYVRRHVELKNMTMRLEFVKFPQEFDPEADCYHECVVRPMEDYDPLNADTAILCFMSNFYYGYVNESLRNYGNQMELVFDGTLHFNEKGHPSEFNVNTIASITPLIKEKRRRAHAAGEAATQDEGQYTTTEVIEEENPRDEGQLVITEEIVEEAPAQEAAPPNPQDEGQYTTTEVIEEPVEQDAPAQEEAAPPNPQDEGQYTTTEVIEEPVEQAAPAQEEAAPPNPQDEGQYTTTEVIEEENPQAPQDEGQLVTTEVIEEPVGQEPEDEGQLVITEEIIEENPPAPQTCTLDELLDMDDHGDDSVIDLPPPMVDVTVAEGMADFVIHLPLMHRGTYYEGRVSSNFMPEGDKRCFINRPALEVIQALAGVYDRTIEFSGALHKMGDEWHLFLNDARDLGGKGGLRAFLSKFMREEDDA